MPRNLEKGPEFYGQEEEVSKKETGEEESKNLIVGVRERFGAEVKETGVIPEELLNIDKKELEEAYFSYADKLEIQDIEYKTKEGKTFSFGNLLPEGWKMAMKFEEGFLADYNNKEVIYGGFHLTTKEYIVPENQPLPEGATKNYFIRKVNPETRKVTEYKDMPVIYSKGFFLQLLHEIGHARSYETLDAIGKLVKHTIAREEILKKKEKLLPLSEDEKLFMEKEIVPEEKQAWVWALQTFRKLRREGIDLEPTMPSSKEILKPIQAALSTYEKDLDQEATNKVLKTLWGEDDYSEKELGLDRDEQGGFTKVNEILSYGIEPENSIHIHLASSKELGIGKVSKLFKEGLEELAKTVKANEKIKEITATSSIVAEHPKTMEKLGFTLKGKITEELRQKHFADDNREIHQASMAREEFLAKYLKE